MKRIIVCLSLLSLSCFAVADTAEKLQEIGTKVADETRHLTKIAEIKAQFVDNKEIKSRYIRVRYDGNTLQLAGFVQNTNVIDAVERIGREAVPGKTFESHWQVAEGLADHDPYDTYVGEQASDLAIWLKVKAVLLSPSLQPLLKAIHIQTVDVHAGQVKIYLIADAPMGKLDLKPRIKKLKGVKGVAVFVLKAYPKAT